MLNSVEHFMSEYNTIFFIYTEYENTSWFNRV